MNKIFDNILMTILGAIAGMMLIIAVIMWIVLLFLWIKEAYDINQNLLFIIIPVLIIFHIYGYLTIKNN